MAVSRAKNLNRAFIDKLRYEAEKQGITLERYDADYLFAVMLEWLGENKAALTGSGVRRFRK